MEEKDGLIAKRKIKWHQTESLGYKLWTVQFHIVFVLADGITTIIWQGILT